MGILVINLRLAKLKFITHCSDFVRGRIFSSILARTYVGCCFRRSTFLWDIYVGTNWREALSSTLTLRRYLHISPPLFSYNTSPLINAALNFRLHTYTLTNFDLIKNDLSFANKYWSDGYRVHHLDWYSCHISNTSWCISIRFRILQDNWEHNWSCLPSTFFLCNGFLRGLAKTELVREESDPDEA